MCVPRRTGYKSRVFLLPVCLISILYPLPKFFELRLERVPLPAAHQLMNGTGSAYQLLNGTVSAYQLMNGTGLAYQLLNGTVSAYQLLNGTGSAYQLLNGTGSAYQLLNGTEAADQLWKVGTAAADNQAEEYELQLVPTELRKDKTYIRVYLIWMNLFIQVRWGERREGGKRKGKKASPGSVVRKNWKTFLFTQKFGGEKEKKKKPTRTFVTGRTPTLQYFSPEQKTVLRGREVRECG